MNAPDEKPHHCHHTGRKHTLPVLDAHQLRELADAASSLRRPEGEPFYGVIREGVLQMVPGTDDPPCGALFEIDTRTVHDRPAVTRMEVECDGAKRELAHEFDAVFWSEAAVEKFVIPYYASKSLWEAASVLTRLSRYWYLGVPTDTDPLPRLTEQAFAQPVPFALAHMPDSDWTPVENSTGHELHLLFSVGGKVHPVPLSALPEHRKDWHPDFSGSDAAGRRHAGGGGA